MENFRIAVLRGGPSDEYSVSMRTGKAVIDALSRHNLFVKDVVVSREGEWLESGKVKSPEFVLSDIDVGFYCYAWCLF
jgi:D-alanine-D-alanine ligase-like ATP-grasp enzyme